MFVGEGGTNESDQSDSDKNKDTIVVASSIGFTDTCTLKTQYLSKLLIYNSLTILSAEFMIIIILPH